MCMQVSETHTNAFDYSLWYVEAISWIIAANIALYDVVSIFIEQFEQFPEASSCYHNSVQ